METNNQLQNRPWLWKKGQSGNPAGRPKGMTLKEYAKEFLSKMTDEERDAFMDGLPKEVIWKMAEGNPHTTTGIEHDGTVTLKVIRFDGDIVSPQLDAGEAPTPSPAEQREVQGGGVAPQGTQDNPSA